jgi:hypothetical protein
MIWWNHKTLQIISLFIFMTMSCETNNIPRDIPKISPTFIMAILSILNNTAKNLYNVMILISCHPIIVKTTNTWFVKRAWISHSFMKLVPLFITKPPPCTLFVTPSCNLPKVAKGAVTHWLVSSPYFLVGRSNKTLGTFRTRHHS